MERHLHPSRKKMPVTSLGDMAMPLLISLRCLSLGDVALNVPLPISSYKDKID